jgi:hypothetical protein
LSIKPTFRLVLLGGGGHARDVLGALEAMALLTPDGSCKSMQVVGVLDDADIDTTRMARWGVQHLGALADLRHVDADGFVACAGYPLARKALAVQAERLGLAAFSVLHPRAWVSPGTVVGSGVVVLAGACISPGVTLGEHSYVSHGALVGHDTVVGPYASLMPGASVSGDVQVGEGCVVGANATVLQCLALGAWSVVGAGAVVTLPVPPGATALGVPARWRVPGAPEP